MTIQLKPLSEVNQQAVRLLSEKLEIADTFRFINQFTTGHGNYTEARDALFGHLTLDDIVSAIENKRPSQLPKGAEPDREQAGELSQCTSTQEVREYARAQGIAEDSEALERGLEAKSQEFRAEGAELYPGA